MRAISTCAYIVRACAYITRARGCLQAIVFEGEAGAYTAIMDGKVLTPAADVCMHM